MKNKLITLNFDILMGLPGSGKTYWAEHNFPKPPYEFNHQGKMIVYLDKYINEDNFIYKALDEEFKIYMENYFRDEIYICIDGPITTYNHLYEVIKQIFSYINTYSRYKDYMSFLYNFTIHQWEDNRELCKYNDARRNRETKATISIDNFSYEDINIKRVKRFLTENYSILNIKSIKKVNHMIEKATTYQELFEPACDNHYGHGNDEQGRYLYSETWSLGGEWGNCWGDRGHVSAEQPKEFIELDDFLESICPNISFLQYKKLRNHCIEQIEWHVHDYYSSGTTDACWRCDMKKLYNMMKEMNLIED